MRRPLCGVAICLLIAAAVWLEAGGADRARQGGAGSGPGEADRGRTVCISGQVYQKDIDSIYLKSVIYFTSDEDGQAVDRNSFIYDQSAADMRQISLKDNYICEMDGAMEIPLGATVVVEGVFAPFSQARSPGEFDQKLYYRTQKINGRLKKAALLQAGEECWRIREGLFGLKMYFKERLEQIFPPREAALMAALLLGEKGGLDGELKDLYRRSGILHILSISSLHITILGMSVYKLLRRLGVPTAAAAAAGSILLLLYGAMVGFGVSACRAIGMYLIRMFGETAGRTYDMLTALGVMAAVMVAGNPLYLSSSGFLLSFGSVLGIGVVSPALFPKVPRKTEGAGRGRRAVKGGTAKAGGTAVREKFRAAAGGLGKVLSEKVRDLPGKVSGALGQSLRASISITLATLPIQLFFYYEVPTYSVFLNLLVIPFMKPLMILGLLAMAVPGLEFLGGVDCMILGGYELLCGCFDRLPFRAWNPGCPQPWQGAVYYLALAAAAGLRVWFRKRGADGLRREESEKGIWARQGKQSDSGAGGVSGAGGRFCQGKPEALGAAALICLGVLLLGLRPPLENSAAFLDVGQGDCILVRTASGQNCLFDCGSSSRSGVGEYVLLPYLKYYGIHSLDAVFLSHPDEDHVNGVLELLGAGKDGGIGVGQLLLPAIQESAREAQLGELLEAAQNAQGGPVPVGYLSQGDRWDCGSAVFTCLHPREGYAGDEPNTYSECVLVEFGGKKEPQSGEDTWSLLLTGDVEGEGEEALMAELLTEKKEGVTVLKAAHHGSRGSTSRELLELLHPVATVISCGRDNRYGHPHRELLERLEASGTCILQTAESGTVTLVFREGALRISAMLDIP